MAFNNLLKSVITLLLLLPLSENYGNTVLAQTEHANTINPTTPSHQNFHLQELGDSTTVTGPWLPFGVEIPTGRLPWGCDFDKGGMCQLTQGKLDSLDWIRFRRATSTRRTGPSHDHTTMSATGFYIYLEASLGSPGSRARIITPEVCPSGPVCVEFAYHMSGAHIGTLNVYQYKGYESRLLWTRTGEQGADWLWARMTAASLNGSIVIEGIRGNGYLGDIAMDDIIIRLGACEQFSDGMWSAWSTWSHCQTAGKTGVKSRTRQCNNPPPGEGGRNCIGPTIMEATCKVDCAPTQRTSAVTHDASGTMPKESGASSAIPTTEVPLSATRTTQKSIRASQDSGDSSIVTVAIILSAMIIVILGIISLQLKQRIRFADELTAQITKSDHVQREGVSIETLNTVDLSFTNYLYSNGEDVSSCNDVSPNII